MCHDRSSRTTPSTPPEGAVPWILTHIQTQFPIIPHTWAWLSCHTCTSFTHTHISSTLPCTHCEVLICPGCHFWALLPVFVFPVITSALILDSVILLWLPWLWLFPWTLILAAYPDYSACLSDYVSALSTLFPLLVIDPVLFDHSNKQSCKWIPLRLMFHNIKLRQTAIQQHWCSWRLNSQLKPRNLLCINISCSDSLRSPRSLLQLCKVCE